VAARRRSLIAASFGAVIVVVFAAVAAAVAPYVLPDTTVDRDIAGIAAAGIFAGSYLALAVGRVPGLGIDRAGIALVGACLMVAAGILTPEEAYHAVNLDTLTLLLGVMIVAANLRLSGFFTLANAWLMRVARRPVALLAAVVAISGVFSAFLVNDAICLILSPLVLEMTLALGRKPTPYLLAVAMASNVGSTATITGNPQNILIGTFSGLPYLSFVLALAPVAAAGLLLTLGLITVVYRQEFMTTGRVPSVRPQLRIYPALIIRALLATAIMILLFFLGQPPAKAAIVVGGLLLLTRRLRSERVYAEIDWSLLLMFAGLFIIVAGAQQALLTPDMTAAAGRMHLDRLPVLSAVAAVLSNIVSNVPAVLVLKPFVEALPNPDSAWLTLAMASTLAGNFTVLGSIANLIVVHNAAARGVRIGFWEYFAVGAPLTVLTILAGTFWLSFTLS
jgi:Na+/H+ antiporter NhaD/arsenite permease-like protein